MMLPVVMNSNYERLAVIDDYNSFIWTTRYYTCGDFELCVDANEKNMQLFQKDYFILRDDDENAGIVEDIKIQRDEDLHEILIISGRFLPSILGRRIIAEQTTVTGNIGSCVNQLINQNVISPAISARIISGISIDTYSVSGSMKAQYTGKNLLDTITDISNAYGLGYKMIFDDDLQMMFSMYAGIDRTYDQSVNPVVIFSDLYDNLLSSEYEENYKNIASAVLVAGEGEGLNRKTLWVTDGSTGLNRHEVYKDQRQIRSDSGDISDAEYNELLQEAGKESLTQYTAAFAGTVYFDNIKYKE